MKRISANQRTINILNRALALGFEFDETNSMEDIRINAEEHLIENDSATEEYCEVVSTGNSQTVSYQDGYGFDYTCSGQITDYASLRFAEAGTKVYHTTLLDSNGKVVRLYDLIK